MAITPILSLARSTTMREMFRQAFSAITTLFRAVERGANTLDHYASWAEAESKDFADTSALERKDKIAKLEKKLEAVAA
jgi:hypothetical protein